MYTPFDRFFTPVEYIINEMYYFDIDPTAYSIFDLFHSLFDCHIWSYR